MLTNPSPFCTHDPSICFSSFAECGQIMMPNSVSQAWIPQDVLAFTHTCDWDSTETLSSTCPNGTEISTTCNGTALVRSSLPTKVWYLNSYGNSLFWSNDVRRGHFLRYPPPLKTDVIFNKRLVVERVKKTPFDSETVNRVFNP